MHLEPAYRSTTASRNPEEENVGAQENFGDAVMKKSKLCIICIIMMFLAKK